MTVPDPNDDSGTSIAFDKAADCYDATRGFPPGVGERVGDLFASAINQRNARVLDVGTGTGRIALPLLRRGFRLTGVDLSIPMMRKLQEKLAAEPENAARLTLVRGDATRLPFGEATFDAVITVHMLHLIPDWKSALDEMRRALRPSGVLLHGRGRGQHGAAVSRSPWVEVRTRWREIVSEMGYRVGYVGAESDEKVLDALRAEAREVEELPPLTWISTDSYGRAFQFVAARYFSDTWRVPDEIFTESIRRLGAWLAQAHPHMDQQYETEEGFNLCVVRF
jgi:SAM-dependent methyltransferase